MPAQAAVCWQRTSPGTCLRALDGRGWRRRLIKRWVRGLDVGGRECPVMWRGNGLMRQGPREEVRSNAAGVGRWGIAPGDRRGHRNSYVQRQLVVGGPLEDHRAGRQIPRRHGGRPPADIRAQPRGQIGVALARRLPSAPGPHCSQAWAMFMPVSSEAGQAGIAARLNAMSSSNRTCMVFNSSPEASFTAKRKPTRALSNAAPIPAGATSPVTERLTQPFDGGGGAGHPHWRNLWRLGGRTRGKRDQAHAERRHHRENDGHRPPPRGCCRTALFDRHARCPSPHPRLLPSCHVASGDPLTPGCAGSRPRPGP